MRAVIDTNVLLSGLLWRGPPHAVMEHVRAGAITFVTTVALLEEFAEVIRRPKFQAILARVGVSENQILSELSRLAEIIDPPPLPEAVCRDPDDDAVLAAAAAGQAELIISGDADLLVLGSYANIPIVDAATVVVRFAK